MKETTRRNFLVAAGTCAAAGILFTGCKTMEAVSQIMEIHATFLDNLLSRDFIKAVPFPLTVALAFGLAISCGILTSFFTRARPLVGISMGGERRTLSIFFSDLESFTSISEVLDPVALTRFLNQYLTAMTDIIHQEEGTIDKYEGDAVNLAARDWDGFWVMTQK